MQSERDEVLTLSWPLIGENEKSGSNGIKVEVKKQLWLAGPLIAVSLLQFCLQVISVMFVGHLGSLPLSAASVATSFASVTGFSFLMGTASALDTVCGQSYGAKMYGMLGIQMQRAMFVLTLYSIPLSIVWANTEHFLVFFGLDKSIAYLSGSYAKFMIPSIFAYGLLQCINRFLQAQNNVFPVVLCSGVTTCLHVILCWVLVLKSGLGFRGAAVANSISYWLNVILLACYVKFSPSCSLTWTGFSKEALRDIIPFMKLAIPSALMVCLEMWSFELLVLSSGLLPNPVLETSVLSICLNTSGTIWMIPFGLGGAASTRVSNELGAGNAKVAKRAVRVVLSIAILESTLVGSVMILIRKIWGFAYSSDPKVVTYVASMMPILAIGHLLDSVQSVFSGVARGCGWQKIGAFVNLGSYYFVGVPLGLLLGFHFHLGGRGLWLGIICALVIQGVSLSVITFFTNWEEEVKKATSRAEGAKDHAADNDRIVRLSTPYFRWGTQISSRCFSSRGHSHDLTTKITTSCLRDVFTRPTWQQSQIFVQCRRVSSHASDDHGSVTVETLDALCKEGRVLEAVEAVQILKNKGYVVDLPRLLGLAKLCGETAVLEEAKVVHDFINGSVSTPLNVASHNTILKMYCDCESTEDALNVFKEMSERNSETWCVMMRYLAKNGDGELAIDMFTRFKKEVNKPDKEIFKAVFFVCASLGDSNEGLLHFESMYKDYGIIPSMEDYVSLTEMLAACGHLEEALEFVETMTVEPSVEVWETLMNLCWVHGDVELGDRLAELVQKLDATRMNNEGLVAEKASDSTNEMMRELKRRLYPEKIGSRTHEFKAGDTSKLECSETVPLLKSLKVHMLEMGFVPAIRLVNIDGAEDEDKEEQLLFRSDKLAFAHSFLNTKPRGRVCVMQSMRICHDGHETCKMLTLITGRELVTRGSKRFHHFKNGVCSCQDYW
ncbi:hypothetical protein F2Q69_00001623 [Brassica cretica]|uniref:Protein DETOXIFICATION n=1 Tax=Brassica cretica TaxID=69181 RepID=A0A8S9PAJ6_BRACR|nr:hypothetical protein F2Q69_00001623 [Brassica cretica]